MGTRSTVKYIASGYAFISTGERKKSKLLTVSQVKFKIICHWQIIWPLFTLAINWIKGLRQITSLYL